MPIYTIDTLTSKYTIPGETDNGMPTLVTQEQVQERHRDFTMVPNILIDGFGELSDAFRFGFIRFVRLFGQKGYFIGSLRKLGKKLKVARMTINRMVAAWEHFMLIKVEKQEDTETVRIIPEMDLLWQINAARGAAASVTNCDTNSEKVDQPVTNCARGVTICDNMSQPQAQNEAQDIINKITIKDKERLPTSVDDALPPYEGGLKPQAFFAKLECDAEERSLSITNRAYLDSLSPRYAHVDNETDNHYHIVPTPTSGTVTTSLSAIGDVQETPAPTAPSKRVRKPRVPKIDADMAVKVAKIFDGFDKLLQEVTGEPEACYAREKTAQAAIIDTLLPCKPTWERLHKVYLELWNRPRNAKDNFLWQEHMTIKAICNNYQTTWLGLQAKASQTMDTGPLPGMTDLAAEMARKQALYGPKGGTRGTTSTAIN